MPQAPAHAAPPSLARSLSIAAVIMMGSVLLSRLLGVAREVVLAGYGGTSHEMDAYVAAFLLPELLNHLLAGGFMSISFIPIFQRHLVAGDERGAWRTFSNLFTIGTALMIGFICACVVFTREILGLMGKSVSDPAQLELTVTMTRIILPAQLFFYWGSLLMAVQFAHKRFLVPGLAPLVYNAGIIAGGVLLYPRLGMQGFSWGVLAGAFLGNCLVQFYGCFKTGMRVRLVVDVKDPDLKKYVLVTLPLILGLGVQFSNEFFFRFFGSFLAAGALAAINYSVRVMWTLVSLFGQAVGTASFPFLSRLAAEKRIDEMNSVATSVITRIAAVAIPTAGILAVLSTNVVTVLFQRGRFTEDSTALTSSVLVCYLVGVFWFCVHTIVARLFYALQNTVLPMLVSTAAAACAVPLYVVLSRAYGAQGIGLAGSAAAMLECVTLYTIWTRRHSGGRHALKVVKVILQTSAATLCGAALCWWIRDAVAAFPIVRGLRPLWGNLLVCGSAGIPALAAVAVVLDVWGVSRDWRRLLRGTRRSAPSGPEAG